MRDIEIVMTASGPALQLHGNAEKVANEKGISGFKLSISHSDDVAIAVVVASAASK